MTQRILRDILKTRGNGSFVAIAMAAVLFLSGAAEAASRVKDIATFEGIRSNQLVGYGLVVGLNGTGDDLTKNIFTKESLVGMLERLGVRTRDDISSLEAANIAAVMVSAELPAFARQGTRIDVSVSTMGSASSLLGGSLLVTPLLAADGEVYVVAQGALVVGGFVASGDVETITKGVPTAARIPNGAIVEREIGFDLNSLDNINIALRNPDLTTARRTAQAINEYLGTPAARSTDPSTVNLVVPATHAGDLIGLITDIEQLRVDPDSIATVVIEEATGTIVVGQNVRIDPVAIAQGALTITVTEADQVSQPTAFSTTGTTTTVERTLVDVEDNSDKKMTVINPGVTLQTLVNSLNSLGIGPRDMISILQAIKVSGALHADIEII
ncbi:MAG: flagellar basal body P-ring protein FlgI [Alphaproteobacteria bacterium]|nr:flagellar basal body P-ring protein FlgI [Alphaproteobacteria bacterium]